MYSLSLCTTSDGSRSVSPAVRGLTLHDPLLLLATQMRLVTSQSGSEQDSRPNAMKTWLALSTPMDGRA